ncbi:Nmad5 family putative nucleotide modification protein [Limnobacter sp.]|uniref:Nmad5 family putative nucleotide modification protein n=1 Tax=Limnobacter sp. TaxID=2003368 RepID=UPI0025C06FDC|nr:Nmad5 family putative nucleotide modification protein [Limnobacter sp.]
MASVRLGKESRSIISRQAKKAFTVANQRPDLDHEIKEMIWQGIEEHPVHRAMVEFTTRYGSKAQQMYAQKLETQSIEGCVWVPDQKEKNEWYIKNSFVDFKLATTRKLYTSYSFARDNMFRFTIDDLALPNEADKFTVLTALETCRAERKQMDDQQAEYNNQIDRLVDSCNTLKQLLDAQPSMKEFVPQEMLQELHKKVTRESQARERREIANVDSDLLNKVVLTSKLVS